MIKIFATICLFVISLTSYSQINNAIKWQFNAVKKADGSYSVFCTADLKSPWHIYSQFTPEGGPLPTKITFSPNPMITINGGITEQGEQKTIHDKSFGVDVKYFSGHVSFVQVVKVKAGVKTNLHGTVEYMICNDNKCLPPAKVNFDIILQ
jgi:thiol:disulfide interchange protein DsbD